MNIFFISLYDEGHRDLYNAFYRIKKYWFVPKKLVFYTCESRLSMRFSRNRVFFTILLEFSRYLLAVFDVMKVLILQKKSMEPIFDFLILWFFINKKPKRIEKIFNFFWIFIYKKSQNQNIKNRLHRFFSQHRYLHNVENRE